MPGQGQDGGLADVGVGVRQDHGERVDGHVGVGDGQRRRGTGPHLPGRLRQSGDGACGAARGLQHGGGVGVRADRLQGDLGVAEAPSGDGFQQAEDVGVLVGQDVLGEVAGEQLPAEQVGQLPGPVGAQPARRARWTVTVVEAPCPASSRMRSVGMDRIPIR